MRKCTILSQLGTHFHLIGMQKCIECPRIFQGRTIRKLIRGVGEAGAEVQKKNVRARENEMKKIHARQLTLKHIHATA